MSEELILVFGVILGVGAIGYMLSQGVSGTMGNLSASQILSYAQAAGFPGDDAIIATAIALAESGGNPEAHGDLTLPGSGSYGLWQIYSKAHPEYGPDFTQLYDPQTNANAAFAIYSGRGGAFTDWSTYNNADTGKTPNYLTFLPQASQAAQS